MRHYSIYLEFSDSISKLFVDILPPTNNNDIILYQVVFTVLTYLICLHLDQAATVTKFQLATREKPSFFYRPTASYLRGYGTSNLLHQVLAPKRKESVAAVAFIQTLLFIELLCFFCLDVTDVDVFEYSGQREILDFGTNLIHSGFHT